MQLLGPIIFIAPEEVHLQRHVSIYFKVATKGSALLVKWILDFIYLLL